MHTRILLRLVLVVAAFTMAGLSTAMAEDDCKDAVVAEGQPAKFRDLGAYPNSLLAWRKAAKEKYGSEYNSWRYAKDRDVNCEQADGMWVCKRKAKPCKDVLHKVIDSAKAAVKGECKAESLNSYGAAKKGEDAAVDEAISGWKIDTSKKYGKEWADWDNATGTDIDCHNVKGGLLQCIADGTPCQEK
jgi:uncharacterized protein YukE